MGRAIESLGFRATEVVAVFGNSGLEIAREDVVVFCGRVFHWGSFSRVYAGGFGRGGGDMIELIECVEWCCATPVSRFREGSEPG